MVFASPQHDDAAMNNRGDHVMGFDHDKTTHHFALTKSGGSIQVQANDSSDSASRDHIRMHLQHIAKAFAAGDFEDPMEVHSQVPPGVPVMKNSKTKISYRYESIERGGKVVIQTDDEDVVKAVHEYLRFQIEEHKTGDPTTVQ
jgi:hypothetical protein